MRLIDIKESIQIISENLDIEYSYDSNSRMYTVKNVLDFQKALRELEKIELFSQNDVFSFPKVGSTSHTYNVLDVSSVYNTILTTNQDMLVLDVATFEPVRIFLIHLKPIIEVIESWFDDIVPDEQDESTINIKLPLVKDLDNLSKIVNDLKISLSTIVSGYKGGKVEVVQFDHGSFWLILEVGAAVSLIASLSWSAAVIAKKINESRYTNGLIRNLKVRNEALEEVGKALKEKIKEETALESKLIREEYFPDKKDDIEMLTRLDNSISVLAELIIKGTEIHPAITSSEDVNNLFPNFNQLSSIESRQKKLDK